MSHPNRFEAGANGPGETEYAGPDDLRGGPSYLRPLLLGAAGLFLLIVAVALLLQLFVARRLPELSEQRLDTAQKLWQRRGPRGYDMDIEIRGAQPGSVHVEVRDGRATALTRDGRSPPPRTWDVWTVAGQFETLERELVLAEDPEHEMGAAAGAQLQLRCEFDSQYGFPSRYHRFATGGAPEVFWEVIRFVPRGQ
jgi:hypothetical protein